MDAANVNLLSPQQVSKILTDCQGYWDMQQLVNALSLRNLKQVLGCLNIHVAVQAIFILSTSRRCRLLDQLEAEEKENWCTLLKAWQTVEKFNHHNKIMDNTVVIGEVPDHYPKEMGKCIVCGIDYKDGNGLYWRSMRTADCQQHSFHEECEIEESICPECP
jgi:hypothetical protein